MKTINVHFFYFIHGIA